MIRRTFAVAGAAVLAIGITGLAGPAAAADDAGTIQAVPAVVLAEIGVGLNTTIDGDFIELANTTGSEVSLAAYSLEACNATTGLTPIVVFTANDRVPANGKFLIANTAYNNAIGEPLRDRAFGAGVDTFLDPDHGGVQLIDTGPNPDMVDNVKWGTPDPDCVNFTAAQNTPTTTQSIDRATTNPWDRANPSPTNATGSIG